MLKKVFIGGGVFILLITAFGVGSLLIKSRWGDTAPAQDIPLSLEAKQVLSTLPKDPIQLSKKDTATLLNLDEANRAKILKIYQDNPTPTGTKLKSLLSSKSSVPLDEKYKALSEQCLEILEGIPERRIKAALQAEKSRQDLKDWEIQNARIKQYIERVVSELEE